MANPYADGDYDSDACVHQEGPGSTIKPVPEHVHVIAQLWGWSPDLDGRVIRFGHPVRRCVKCGLVFGYPFDPRKLPLTADPKGSEYAANFEAQHPEAAVRDHGVTANDLRRMRRMFREPGVEGETYVMPEYAIVQRSLLVSVITLALQSPDVQLCECRHAKEAHMEDGDECMIACCGCRRFKLP